MTDYLLEIGCEEIPARFIPDFLTQLQESLSTRFKEARLTFKEPVQAFATYRRFILRVPNLAPKQEDLQQEMFGPPINIAYDGTGNPLPPAIGFAKRSGVSVESLSQKENQGKVVCVANISQKGQPIKSVLAELIPDILNKLSLPIAMRWADQPGSFIRPIHWIVSLYGKTVVPFEAFQIKADRITYGHRFFTKNQSKNDISSGKAFKLESVSSFFSCLEKKGHVIVDDKKRKDMIQSFLKEKKQEVIDEELLDEVSHLVEHPTPIECDFNKKYLTIPEEVLVECMKKHQKYFPVYKKGKLTEKFIVIADNLTSKNHLNIRQGNQRVLTARLEDATFFWESDLKNKLFHNTEKLHAVLFQKNLGSLYEKKERVKALALWINQQLGFQISSKDLSLAADLCKADLVSQMVFEFPTLQGVVGSLIAYSQGYPKIVSDSIKEHYYPQHQADQLPQSKLGILLALADRFDTIVCCFQNKLIPTGSQDPWGVRRAVFGIISIIESYQYSLNIESTLDKTYALLTKKPQNREHLISFIHQRIKGLYTEYYPHDMIDSVIHDSLLDLPKAKEMVKAMITLKESEQESFKMLTETAVRIKRLAAKANGEKVDQKLFIEPEEKKAWKNFEKTRLSVEESLANGKLTRAVENLSSLTPPLTNYFNKILIMTDDKKIRTNRLAFLKQCDSLYQRCANFEMISI